MKFAVIVDEAHESQNGDNAERLKKALADKTLTEEQQENRKLLREAMERNGFKIANTEWWHFSLIEEPYPKENFNFPVKSLSNMLPKPEEKQSSKSSGKDKKKGKTEKEKKKKK